MKKFAAFISLASVLASTIVSASPPPSGEFQTTFTNQILVNGTPKQLSSDEETIALPPAFSEWECKLMRMMRSDDGKFFYRNLFCRDMNAQTTVLVGITTMCPKSSEWYDQKVFFLRVPGIDVAFEGTCSTFFHPNTTASSMGN